MSRLGRLLLLAGFSATGLTGCPSRESIGTTSMSVLGAGVVNAPQNKSLRFDLLKFGLESFCHELLKGGAPLKMADDEPVVGRFFAAGCQSQILDEDQRKSFIVQFQGKGYGFGGPIGRVGFDATGLIEYAPDFQLHDGAMYVYFRPRLVDTSKFQLLLVEADLAQSAAAVLGVNPEAFGRKIVDSQLRRGFTVVRYSSTGETEFGVGIIPPGERPFHPFQVQTEDKRVLVNERTEVHGGQQDYVGAFDVEGNDQALYLTLSVDGAPAVDVRIVPQGEGDKLIDAYIRTRGPQPVTVQPLLDEAVPAGQLFRRFVKVPAGRYYLLLDHGNLRGHGPAPSPSPIPLGAPAAKVDYLLLLGDAP